MHCRFVSHVVPQHGLPRPPQAMQYDDMPLPMHVVFASVHVVLHPVPGCPTTAAESLMQYCSEP
jgi:hypothetical protein